ncbi:hypothetical protein PHYSODRAFT_339760 [Plasmopara halstedii]|uniref:Uncharacterized protein n=1 Tax=Plasmopara halstedii TaxID=4781 RepID=A0A0P1AZA3_PLAHL|nr:hypothetical protein PHYSODRAFT_339760 [Plasmopara halstedii]CEG46205.1 hypothetical protein PHYSODRAFT_339760 [Plasmopara halstedii]|eukprot:XP_024582574.1 hypothetical protein PHYSODRAFT_339760 [Plasmopara halstedii]
MKKRRLNDKNPIHLSIAINQLAKLRMLQFYYDCIDFDRFDFQYQEMDTDSAYIAFSCDQPFRDCMKPELRTHFKEYNNNEIAEFDRRTPGLFKDERSGDAMISLSNKDYICYLPNKSYKVKVSVKGIQQGGGRNNGVLNSDGFETVVRERITLQGRNKGFRVLKETKSIITYTQNKTAINYGYDKRRVLDDGITTEPLDIKADTMFPNFTSLAQREQKRQELLEQVLRRVRQAKAKRGMYEGASWASDITNGIAAVPKKSTESTQTDSTESAESLKNND